MLKKEQSLKPIALFLLYTFSITYLSWAIIIIANKYFDALWYGEPLFWIPMLIGGVGPAIGAYILYRQFDGEFSERLFMEFIFSKDIDKRGWIIFGLYTIWRFIMIWSSFGIKEPLSIIYMLISLPFMIVGGGLEELGWRGYLQPKLEKMIGYLTSTLVVGLIWSLWHLPLWLVKGTVQSSLSFSTYTILAIILSFTLTTIYKYTQNVFLCVLTHAWFNGCIGLAVYIGNDGYIQLNLDWKVIMVFAIELIISLILGVVYNKKAQNEGLI
ncbi:MAG: CPBP family intramembrane metalloprotease [Clostridiales bacterium]|nr:CPBP family intramembrane metalloprotease [Clostridiales bacterium]